ncbi:MAG: hypothetical protein ABI616_05955 [Pseudomonadota bacterium]
MKGLSIITAAGLLALGVPAMADNDVAPIPAAHGTWVHIGKTSADFSADHDTIEIHGDANFRKLRFKVHDAPLHLTRMVVTYANGDPDTLAIEQNIAKGGHSRTLDLKGSGRRSIQKVDFWYSTKGKGQGKSDIELEGER